MKSLEELCLSSIVDRFERFHFAFTISNFDILKRNFDFLQRKYSSGLATQLFKKGEFKDEYLEFAMNEHLKFFDEQWLEDTRYHNSTKDIFCRLPNLTKISCFDIDDEILENVCKFCPKVVEIDSKYSSVTDDGIKHLYEYENGKVPCPDLKKLPELYSSRVTDESVKCLIQNLPLLENIDYEYVPRILHSLHKEDLRNLQKLPCYNLVQLDFYGEIDSPFYNDLLKLCLIVCPKLKSIRCNIFDEQQFDLLNNISLEELDLEVSAKLPKININNFLKSNGCKLVSLKLSNCLMSINILSASCPKLRILDMEDIEFSDDHYDLQSDFRHLTECTFRYFYDYDGTIDSTMSSLLSFSPNLESLVFMNCDLPTETKTGILKCCENYLLTLDFDSTDVEVAFIIDILRNSPCL